MKRLNLFLVGLSVIGLAYLTSCSEETTSAPVITFDNAAPVAAVGGSVTLNGEIVAEAKLDEVKIFVVTGTDETQFGAAITDFSSTQVNTDDDLNYVFHLTVGSLTADCQIKIVATDKDNQTASKSIEVTVGGGAGGAIDEFTAVLMGAQSNTANGSALDAETGNVYKLADATPANIDILYYYGIASGNSATVVAPNDPSVTGTGANSFTWTSAWTVKNATKFGMSTMTSTEFDAMTDDSDISDITGLTASIAPSLVVGDVVEFVLVSGKIGVFKVSALTTGASGSMTITIKVQE